MLRIVDREAVARLAVRATSAHLTAMVDDWHGRARGEAPAQTMTGEWADDALLADMMASMGLALD